MAANAGSGAMRLPREETVVRDAPVPGDTRVVAQLSGQEQLLTPAALTFLTDLHRQFEAGAAAVHFEDQLASAKKRGHMGGKVLVPTREAVEKLIAARLVADVMACQP